MDIDKLKEKIIRRIEETDDLGMLLDIQDIINNQSAAAEPAVAYGIESDEDIAAYTVDGKPMTRAEYMADIEAAEKEFEEGDFYTTDEVKKIVASWKK
ncbi:hypothetical protein OGH69_03245 [Flavobacterium sp. MFBS3-15]|uniref:hypothetical protein n=1 Tax=Flavobacterium sp. MFBS3-15 TaxID=2989816 RepID=UPI002235C811|nr:hypothetical protein [Flavobacterium sp. MFBS3-15]MCW4467969.1 hypothetical protein [Flavobacterium sp. MFBS3-15]